MVDEIEITKLDEQSKQNLDDWLSAVWDIFEELKSYESIEKKKIR